MQEQQEEIKTEVKHKPSSKKLGIWMDHSTANIIKLNNDEESKNSNNSELERENVENYRDMNGVVNENVLHNKEQQNQHQFYSKLAETIKDYDDVLLFGPTDAKVELHNMLKEDHHFDKIRIEIKSSDKMTENQQHAFVRAHFA